MVMGALYSPFPLFFSFTGLFILRGKSPALHNRTQREEAAAFSYSGLRRSFRGGRFEEVVPRGSFGRGRPNRLSSSGDKISPLLLLHSG